MPTYRTVAYWPHSEVQLGNTDNSSTDTHETAQEAEAIAHRLRTEGFGGDGLILARQLAAINSPLPPADLSQCADSLQVAHDAVEFAAMNDVTNYEQEDKPKTSPHNRIRGKLGIAAMMGMVASMGGMGGFGFPSMPGPSASSIRHNPDRPKTPADLEAIEAARVRQEKKRAKRGRK